MGSRLVDSHPELLKLRSRFALRTRLEWSLSSLRYRLPRDVSRFYELYDRHPHSRVEGYGSMIGSRIDAGVLYHLVRRHRPQHVLDLGCGLGTLSAFVAFALEANGRGCVTSIEHLDWMVEKADKLMPGFVRSRVEMLLRETETRVYFGREWACYHFEPRPQDRIDLVIVDGPPTERIDASGRVAEYLPNGDLIRVLPHLAPGCHVFVDGRRPTVAAYRRHLGDLFEIQDTRLDYTLMRLKRPVASMPA